MDFRHFETVRTAINPKMDTRRMFAEWRVEAPWKPWTKKAVGYRHGGGKGPIDRYVTPIRANRIILEIGAPIDEMSATPLEPVFQCSRNYTQRSIHVVLSYSQAASSTATRRSHFLAQCSRSFQCRRVSLRTRCSRRRSASSVTSPSRTSTRSRLRLHCATIWPTSDAGPALTTLSGRAVTDELFCSWNYSDHLFNLKQYGS